MKLFITGVSSGLGLYLARDFLVAGDEVWGIARRDFDIESTDGYFQEKFHYTQCDVTNAHQVKETFDYLIHENYIPDIVLCCAGSATDDIADHHFRLDNFQENFNVNLFGISCWIEKLLPYFLERNQGTFAAISSMSVYKESRRDRIGYSASRIALNTTFENLRMEYLEAGIQFMTFIMGRMQEKSGIIGTSYSKAASRIYNILTSKKRVTSVNIPFSQYVLTNVIRYIPPGIFKTYLMKK